MNESKKFEEIVTRGYAQHRYIYDDGRALPVVTLPLSIVKALGRNKLQKATQAWMAGEESRKRHTQICAMLKRGDKPKDIADQFKISVQRVYQIRKEIDAEPKTIRYS